jgi:archaellum biogenesis ATPase FlaH
MANQNEIKEYTPELEDLFIRFLLSDTTLLTRCLNITKPEYFEHSPAKKAARFLLQYVSEHSIAPSLEILNTTCKLSYTVLTPQECVTHEDWFLKEYELFCRHRGLEIEILNSQELLEQKRYGEVEARIREAVQIGLVKDLGTNAFNRPEEIIRQLLDKGDMVPTGWRDIDKRLYGGTEKGTLNIFAGQSGTGKSLFLQNWALNLVMQGLNVVYITLELSEALSSMRMYAMISGYGTKELVRDPEDTAMRINKFAKKHGGTLQIKYLPPGITATDIRAYIKEYEIQKGIKVDAVMVDYLDLMMPYDRRVSPSDLFVKDKYVSEELRKLATDCHVVLGTASQLNRQSHDEIEYDHSHISGGISKINTADNVIAIFTTMTLKENGRYQTQLLKTRSSSGTGAKIDLKYNMKSMRISDWDEDDSTLAQTPSNIMENLKNRNKLTPPPPKTTESSDSSAPSRLWEMMNKKEN